MVEYVRHDTKPVPVGDLTRGELFRWDPSALGEGEDPDTVYVVRENEGGAVQVIPLETGLPFPIINTVGREWLTIPKGMRVTPDDMDLVRGAE